MHKAICPPPLPRVQIHKEKFPPYVWSLYAINFLQKKTHVHQCCPLVCSVGAVDYIRNVVVLWTECHAIFDK
jgi:hypothetical protein